MLLIQSLPLIALVVLLASGRAGPMRSCVIAALLALPAAWLGMADKASFVPFINRSIIEGLWLAFIPVGIITGGLIFNGGVQQRAQAASSKHGDIVDHAFTASFLLGMFTETVTGFGVGTVFAIGAIRSLGLAGAPAAAIALMAQNAIPWGGLGPGSAIGAALAGIDAQAMSERNAMMLAASLMALLPMFWWWCSKLGLTLHKAMLLRQFLWMALLGGLLIGLHFVLPWQLCGMVASGTVLSARLLLADPPKDWMGVFRRASAVWPYAMLATLLLAGQAWHGAPSWRPFAELPAIGINHPMVAIWLAAIILLALQGQEWGNEPSVALAAIQRAKRPALAMLSFVVLARLLTNAGIPVALATSLVASFGSAAPFASPFLAAIAGFFAGSNVGSNSTMMPLQAALGRASGLGPLVLPAVQNGTLALVISPQLTAVASSLIGGGVTPAKLWRIMWPVAAVGLIAGSVSIVIG